MFFCFVQGATGQEWGLDQVEIQKANKQWTDYNATEASAIQGDYNLRLKLPSAVPQGTYILYLDELQEVDVYLDSAFIGTTGVLSPLSQRNIPDGRIIQAIGNSVQEKITLQSSNGYIYLKGKNRFEKIIRTDFKLYTEDVWKKNVLSKRDAILVLQGIIGGALLIITLYHLLIFFIRRDIPYLHYALYTGLIFFTLWNEMGMSQLFLFTDHQFLHHYLEMSQMMSMLASVLYFFFMGSFIELNKLLPKLDKVIKWYLVALISTSLMMDIAYLFQLTRVWLVPGYFSAISCLLVGLVSVILIFRTKNKLAYYFTLGSLVLYVSVFSNTILSILEFNGVINELPFNRMYISEAGILIEIIIFSLGLGYRMQLIEKEKQQVENIANIRSRFFTNISHEFRTPLTVISGMVDQVKGNPKEKNLIKRNSQSLLKLVNQLLDLSKLDADAMPLDNEQSDIIAYLRYLTESFYSMANEKGIRLMFYTEEEELDMDFDESKIQNIIYNLLGNAIKFTGGGGKIIVHVAMPKNGLLLIKVKDTGSGMSEEDLEKIFDRFYQSENTSSRGSGVGLALTKELVLLLKGEIEVKSDLGVGSEFSLSLPITNFAPPRQFCFEKVYPENITSIEEETKPIRKDKAIILIVEDNPDIISYLKSVLEHNYNILTAKDGEEGLETAENLIPDVIISDVMMPKLGGFELCKMLKSSETTSHIPVILLTAKHTQEDKLSGLSIGADAYLTKPFDRKELLLKIKNLLKLRSKIQEQNQRTNEPTNEFLEKVIDYINANISEPSLTVNELSFSLKLSKMQLNRKMKAMTGLTPAAFINEMRLRKAKELIGSQTYTISEVAYQVGFSDPSYFTKAFSKKFGFNPSEHGG